MIKFNHLSEVLIIFPSYPSLALESSPLLFDQNCRVLHSTVKCGLSFGAPSLWFQHPCLLSRMPPFLLGTQILSTTFFSPAKATSISNHKAVHFPRSRSLLVKWKRSPSYRYQYYGESLQSGILCEHATEEVASEPLISLAFFASGSWVLKIMSTFCWSYRPRHSSQSAQEQLDSLGQFLVLRSRFLIQNW